MKRAIFVIALVSTLCAGNIFLTKDLGAQGNPKCWGSDKPCEDGKFRDYQGKEQPKACDNQPNGPNKDKEGTMHDCMCDHAGSTAPGETCPMLPTAAPLGKPGATCKTYCREHACGCADPCNT